MYKVYLPKNNVKLVNHGAKMTQRQSVFANRLVKTVDGSMNVKNRRM